MRIHLGNIRTNPHVDHEQRTTGNHALTKRQEKAAIKKHSTPAHLQSGRHDRGARQLERERSVMSSHWADAAGWLR